MIILSGVGSYYYEANCLENLVLDLSPYEKRALRDILIQVSYQKDIVSALPLEIAQRILQFIEPPQAFSLRRVSSSWRDILCSKGLYSLMIRLHDGQENTVLSSEALEVKLKTIAERWLAFATGRPYSAVVVDIPDNRYNGLHPPVAFANGVLAYLHDRPGLDSRVVVKSLADNSTLEYSLGNRETLVDLYFSGGVIVTRSHGGVFLVIETTELHINHFRMPPMWQTVAVGVSCHYVIVAAYEDHDKPRFNIYDCHLNKSRIVPASVKGRMASILIHPDEKHFTTFSHQSITHDLAEGSVPTPKRFYAMHDVIEGSVPTTKRFYADTFTIDDCLASSHDSVYFESQRRSQETFAPYRISQHNDYAVAITLHEGCIECAFGPRSPKHVCQKQCESCIISFNTTTLRISKVIRSIPLEYDHDHEPSMITWENITYIMEDSSKEPFVLIGETVNNNDVQAHSSAVRSELSSIFERGEYLLCPSPPLNERGALALPTSRFLPTNDNRFIVIIRESSGFSGEAVRHVAEVYCFDKNEKIAEQVEYYTGERRPKEVERRLACKAETAKH